MSYFCIKNPKYRLVYDQTILNDFKFKNLSIIFKNFLCGPPRSENEGLFYRIIEKGQEKCIQCIFFYKTQRIPYHPHDYHPFFIYLDENDLVKQVIIDDGHHYSKLIYKKDEPNQKKNLVITIFLPDHGLTDKLSLLGKLFNPKLIPLIPEQIIRWWTINNMAQLKLRTKLIDPWSKGLIPDNFIKKDSIIYRLNYISPHPIIPNKTENLSFSFRDEVSCPICGRRELLDFMSVYTPKKTNMRFLRKKMNCTNNHEYYIHYNFKLGKMEYI